MSVGTGTAIAIAVAAGTTAGAAYSAHESSNASENAVDQETQSANEALHVNEREYRQERDDMGPYRHVGTEALSSLSQMMGFSPFVAAPEKTADPNAKPAPAKGDLFDVSKKKIDQFNPSNVRLGPGGMASMGGAQPPQQPGAPVGNQTVQVRAPNGAIGEVPIDRLPDALAAGGTRVN